MHNFSQIKNESLTLRTSYLIHDKIKISADDFGISDRANRNILYLISLGKIDRVAVMPNGKISEKEVAELLSSGVKIDIHLNISKNHDSKKYSTIKRILSFLKIILTKENIFDNTKNEWAKQLEKFINIFGKNPDGINSHEHIHFFPPFFKILLELQNKYSIPYIRFGKIVFTNRITMVPFVLFFLRLLNTKKYNRASCISSDMLISIDWIKDIEKFLKNTPYGEIEMVAHPALAEDFVKIKKYF